MEELKEMVGRECEFLSYYLEEYAKQLSTNPYDRELLASVEVMQSKWEAYDKVYRFIVATMEGKDEPNK